MPTALPARWQTAILLLAIAAAYLWLRLPALQPYSLQAVAFSTFLYVVLNFAERRSAHVWHVLPKSESALLALITFTLLLLIGATGNLESPLYPLTYVHLFFLAMGSSARTALITTFGAMWFHLSLAPEITPSVIVHIAVLPIVLGFFIFAREQHELAVKEKQQLDHSQDVISDLVENEQELATEQELTHEQLRQQTVQLQKKVAEFESCRLEEKQTQARLQSLEHNQQDQARLLDQISQILIAWRRQYFSAEPVAKKTIDTWLSQVQRVLEK